MTPHVKAVMMIEEFWKVNPKFSIGSGDKDFKDAKQCAMICVSEVVSVGRREYSGSSTWEESYAGEFWNDVKMELKAI